MLNKMYLNEIYGGMINSERNYFLTPPDDEEDRSPDLPPSYQSIDADRGTLEEREIKNIKRWLKHYDTRIRTTDDLTFKNSYIREKAKMEKKLEKALEDNDPDMFGGMWPFGKKPTPQEVLVEPLLQEFPGEMAMSRPGSSSTYIPPQIPMLQMAMPEIPTLALPSLAERKRRETVDRKNEMLENSPAFIALDNKRRTIIERRKAIQDKVRDFFAKIEEDFDRTLPLNDRKKLEEELAKWKKLSAQNATALRTVEEEIAKYEEALGAGFYGGMIGDPGGSSGDPGGSSGDPPEKKHGSRYNTKNNVYTDEETAIAAARNKKPRYDVDYEAMDPKVRKKKEQHALAEAARRARKKAEAEAIAAMAMMSQPDPEPPTTGGMLSYYKKYKMYY